MIRTLIGTGLEKGWRQFTSSRLPADYPFISGQKFSSESDLSFETPPAEWRLGAREWTEAKVIFVKGDYLSEFLEHFHKGLRGKKILVGNSDVDFDEAIVEPLSFAQQAFVQNLDAPLTKKVRPLPIGLENPSLRNHGRVKLFQKERREWSEKNDAILLGYASETHEERLAYKSAVVHFEAGEDPRVKADVGKTKLSPSKYGMWVSSQKLVACPRGNGMDTHRFWETLYRGSVPVVLETHWSCNFKKLGVPVVSIKDWDSEEILKSVSKLSEFESFTPSKVEILWWKSWRKALRD